MGSSLTEAIWAPLLAAVGVFIGWWLRHWSEGSMRRTSSDSCRDVGGSEPRTDSVTGLSCHAAFVDDLRRRVADFKRSSRSISLLLMRIDNYDQLLLACASDGANQLLVAMSQFLRATVRDMDHAARVDDRTFGILLPGADEEAALGVAERLSRAVSQARLPAKDRAQVVCISVGVAQVQKGDTASEVLARAESALQNQGLAPRRLECTLKLG